MRRRDLFGLFLILALGSGCTAVVVGSPLSSRPTTERGIFLSTGTSPRPYKTLGFIQVTGYGVEVAGAATVGDSGLDSVLRGTLANEAAKMGADGVINISFLDENPSTPLERGTAAVNSVRNLAAGTGGVETKNRTVMATGELIAFVE